ncbi:hypothetical protein ACRB8A_00340 [Arthrobacter sp. G.S.26]|uniref:hypothetical protein n=1 Tax=Arthrobacter sp. G.S.26 TaxID=3433706 RepID=UPI003D78AD46
MAAEPAPQVRDAASGAAPGFRRGTAPRLYTYRGHPDREPSDRSADVRAKLGEQKTLLAFRSSRLRALSAKFNQHVAQALCDGLKMTAIAKAAGMPLGAIRSAAVSLDDVQPSGGSADEHLRGITQLGNELKAADGDRAVLERNRARLLASARALGLLDDYELASASGLKHEEIRKLTRGLRGAGRP